LDVLSTDDLRVESKAAELDIFTSNSLSDATYIVKGPFESGIFLMKRMKNSLPLLPTINSDTNMKNIFYNDTRISNLLTEIVCFSFGLIEW
jgi:hypothetical protein